MIRLSEHLAQKIVDKMVKAIPYKVIITDDEGIIIGSMDKSRIHKFHVGAKEVITTGEILEVYEDNPLEDIKAGVNSPIFFEKKLVGVIGISGEPDKVRVFSELVGVTIELLINQEYTFNKKQMREDQVEKFLYELAYRNDKYSESLIEKGLSLGIDLTNYHTAVAISASVTDMRRIREHLKALLKRNENLITLNSNTLVVFMDSERNVLKRVECYFEDIRKVNVRVGIGLEENILAISLKQAMIALNIGEKIYTNRKIFLYDELHFISLFMKYRDDYKLNNIIEKLKEQGKQAQLLETLAVYVYCNGEVNVAANKLHIHRNTLNYRLEKIQEISGKNPRNLMDLFELFAAYIVSII